MCEEVGCVENQREAAALLCALVVPYENKIPLAESRSAEPLMIMCQSVDVEVRTCSTNYTKDFNSQHFISKQKKNLESTPSPLYPSHVKMLCFYPERYRQGMVKLSKRTTVDTTTTVSVLTRPDIATPTPPLPPRCDCFFGRWHDLRAVRWQTQPKIPRLILHYYPVQTRFTTWCF